MKGLRFVNFDDVLNRWSLDLVADIVTKTKAYADSQNLHDVELYEVEDSMWSDPDNNRIDITIRYNDDKGFYCSRKLLMLKGEIVDGVEFHKRFEEFYGRRIN